MPGVPLMTPSHRPLEPCPGGRWKHGAIPVVGLVGGVGSGKSRVASLLAARGATVINADTVGHELLGEPEIRARIVERFGTDVLEPPGAADATPPRIDRRALAAIVFADPSARHALETILHPVMRARFLATIDQLARQPQFALIVLDAAILLEAGWDDLCDRIVFVDAPWPERLRRVAETRGWSDSTFEARERAQWSADRKRHRADAILTNDSSPDRLEREVDRLVARILAPPGSSEESPPIWPEPREGPVADPGPAELVFDAHSPLGGRS
jgi:dephospho-CoA kinase